jgi:hypothetical protein
MNKEIALDFLLDVIEAQYKAGDTFPKAIKAFKDLGDKKTAAYLEVLFEQSKRFAGKLKETRIDIIAGIGVPHE